jgi:trans-aconitate methyltransferase
VPNPTDLAAHWDRAYAEGDTARSWYQPAARTSLALLAAATGGLPASVVDVGGGASTLVDGLLAAGVEDVTVLDVSAAATAIAAARLGEDAQRVTWVTTDLLEWRPPRRYAAWHDRAVLHFLTDDADRGRYAALLDAATAPGSVAVLGGFAPDGPEKCSGLPVRRAGAEELRDLVGEGWTLVEARTETHHTPSGGEQAFQWVALRRDT